MLSLMYEFPNFSKRVFGIVDCGFFRYIKKCLRLNIKGEKCENSLFDWLDTSNCQFYHQNFSMIFMRTGVVYLGLDIRMWLLFCFFFYFVFLLLLVFCFFRGFWPSPPLYFFLFFLIKFEIGGIGWEFIGVLVEKLSNLLISEIF